MSNGTSNGNGNGNGAINLSGKTLVSLGVLVSVLIVAIPTAWSFGIQWGELNSEVRRLRADLDEHSKDNEDDFKLFDIRLDKLERVSVNVISPSADGSNSNRNGGISYVHNPADLNSSLRSLPKRTVVLANRSGFANYWRFVHGTWSVYGRTANGME